MTMVKRIVCLANSRKLSGRCVAGIEIDKTGKRIAWIRPVSASPTGELSEYEQQYRDGSEPRVLDIIDVPLLKPLPHEHQQENWLIDPNKRWKRVGYLPWDELGRLADPPGPLWVNGYHTFYGRNDRIPHEQAIQLRDSLRLFWVEGLVLNVEDCEYFGNTKRRVQGQFIHQGVEYRLWVTDRAYENKYLAKPDGKYEIGECFLTVSLGEPHEGYCYKLIAAIIEPDRSGRL